MKNEIHRNPFFKQEESNLFMGIEIASAGLAIVFPSSSLPIPLLSNQSFS